MSSTDVAKYESDAQTLFHDGDSIDGQSVDTYTHIPILRGDHQQPANTTYVKSAKSISLRLLNQHPGCTVPTCDDATAIRGVVGLDNTRGLTGVELHIEGSVRLHEYGGLKRTTQVLSHTINLWPPANGGSPGDAPRELPFEYRVPTEPRLPPSYEVSIGGGSYGNRDANGFNAWVRYRITVRAQGLGSSTFNNIKPLEHLLDRTLTVPILFTSRLRAPHDSLPDASNLAHVPPLEATLRNASSKLEPVQAQVRVPQPTTYCMRRPVPVSIRLAGGSGKLEMYSVNASVLRRSTQIVSVKEENDKTWMEAVDLIGEGALLRVREDADGVAWVGDVSVRSNVMAGSFAVDGLTVRDFLVLDIIPPKNKPGMLLVDARISIPITLTTD
ncbi:hypothetical protein EXIGLDRAFT_778550 [Exidia glandulosa HHB12029]|uniref:Arrestin-like N-terminal domain-containing protein n=1 Tax=Exidia glandulosa HHB12029 TaxID=1314781 RepID=A0A165CH04_EXIGL|nr:hypothetical protein EXIGLDRAFT_778550 [Exidia glandulosa HHB12029]